MKKVLLGLILTLFLAGLMVPVLVSAQAGPPESCFVTHDLKLTSATSGLPICEKNTSVSVDVYPMCCLLNTIYTVIDWVFYVLLAVVVVMIVIGGFYFVTAAGDPEKASKGRQLIIYALIGLIIALLARLIPALVRFFIGLR